MTHPATQTKQQRLIVQLQSENRDLRAELERAKDEICRLKAAIRLIE